jgi:alpha-tubulin suppressor-like RCC1 family protein
MFPVSRAVFSCKSPRRLGLTGLAVFALACGGGGGGGGDGGGATTTPIDSTLVGPLSQNLAAATAGLASQAPLNALATQTVTIAVQAGVQVNPVQLTASQPAAATTGRPSALSSGEAKAFAFQLTVLHLAGTSGPETFSGVFTFQSATDWALAAGPSPGSAIPPAVGVLAAGGQLWLATTGSESAQLSTTGAACPFASALPSAVTACNLASFTNAGFNITASSPASSGASGSRTASLPSQSLTAGISLTIDCALGALCPGGSSGGGVHVGVSPPSASVPTGGTQQFTANVTGTSNTAVTWTVVESGGGSISNAGLYTAPSTLSTYHVKATSVADTTVSAQAAVTVTGPAISYSAVNVGVYSSCGLIAGGTLPGAAYCWGDNTYGELGNGSNTASLTPVAVSGGLTFTQIGVGRGFVCAVTTAGAAYCWGDNTNGELGNGTTANSSTPAAVSGGLTFSQVSAGFDSSCGVTTSGAAYCWGAAGELGNGSNNSSTTPVPVSGGLTFAQVSSGNGFSCGVTTAGAAYCWGGNNGFGVLGNGSTTSSTTPVAVSGGLTFAQVSAGELASCGVTTSGDAYCWGENADGDLGDGSTTNSSTPVAVSGGLTFVQVSVGNAETCGLTTAGAVYCWGDNGEGNFGNGSETSSTTPVAGGGGLSFTQVSTVAFTTCGVTTGGTAYCWGGDGYGQMGRGSTLSSTTPVAVANP